MNLLCLHGFTGTPRVWAPVLKHLPGTTAWCPALLGHGGEEEGTSALVHSDAPQGLSSVLATFSGEVDRIAAWLETRMDEPCWLLGYSMGARVGLGLLLGYPHLFTGATLVGVHPGLVEAADRQRRAALEEARAQSLEKDGVPAFIDHWERIPLFASQQELPSAILSLQREQRLSHTAAGLAQALRFLGLACMPACRTRLPSLDLPIQLVVGEKDKKFGRIAEGMTALLPQAELLRIAGVGHNVVLEAPRELVQVVTRNFVPEAASFGR